jgi:tetratricopeptide (TPR) repeat protein
MNQIKSMTDKKQDDSSLAIPENSGVLSRSTDLIRRGLDSIAKTQRRILRFPKHRSMGKLYLEDGAGFYAPLFRPKEVGDARGHVVVTVPGKKTLSLVVSTKASSDLSPLASLKKDDVEKLDLSSTQITDSGLAYISELSGLKALSLSETGITDFGLASLRKLSNLECLDLSFTNISDAGLLNLQGLTHLYSLNLRSTKVSFEGLLRLRSTLPKSDCAIEADEIPEANFVEIADSMIHSGEYLEAAELLTKAVALMPRNWKPTVDSADIIKIAFWNSREFETYIELHRSEAREGSVMWTYPSYSKAYYLLSYLAAERRNFDEALDAVTKGLELEPDHPKMLCEKGFILRHLNRPEEALETYQRAATARTLTPAPVKAEALRGQGFSLIELNRLDEAEKALKDSLVLEPNSDDAIAALDDIGNMKPLEQTQGQDRDDSYQRQVEIFRRLIRESKAKENESPARERRAERAPDWKPKYLSPEEEQRFRQDMAHRSPESIENMLKMYDAFKGDPENGIGNRLREMREQKQNRSKTEN